MNSTSLVRVKRTSDTSSEPAAGLSSLLMQQKITNRLLAVQLRSSVPQAELILALASTGASNPEIAEVLGTTAATVSNVFVRVRKKAAGQRGKSQTSHSEEDR